MNHCSQSGLAGAVWGFHPCDLQLLFILSFSLYYPFPWWWQTGAQRNREEQSEVFLFSSHSNFKQDTERTSTKEQSCCFFFPACYLLSFTAQQVPYFEREKATETSTHFSNLLINLFAFPVYISLLQCSLSQYCLLWDKMVEDETKWQRDELPVTGNRFKQNMLRGYAKALPFFLDHSLGSRMW